MYVTSFISHFWFTFFFYIFDEGYQDGHIFSVELYRRESLEDLEEITYLQRRCVFYIYSPCNIYRVLYILIFISFYIFN